MTMWINLRTKCGILLCLLLFIHPSQEAGEFDVLPDAASGIVPIGQQAIYHCRASEEFVVSKWDVYVPNVRTFSTNVNGHDNLLQMFGIDFNFTMSKRESYLIINATNSTNGSVVQCDVEDSTRLRTATSPSVQTIFYDRPPPPIDVSTGELSNGRLQLLWNFSYISNVTVTFTLTVQKNNSFNQEETVNVVQNILENTAVININYSFCDVYYFRVMAENDAGQSNQSEATKWIPPYLPNFFAPTLQYSLVKMEEFVFINITINVPEQCPEYSAGIFDVVLDNQTGTKRIWRQSGLQRRQEQLQEDQMYFIQVESNGKLLTQPERIITSDVQDVEVCLQDNSFVIHCIYLTGSTISGCNYTLVHKGGVFNISGRILRTNSTGERIEVNKTTDYNELIVYDSSNEEKLSNPQLSITKSLRGLSNCPTTVNNSEETTQSSNSKLIIVALFTFCFWFISL